MSNYKGHDITQVGQLGLQLIMQFLFLFFYFYPVVETNMSEALS